jgi:hypothetical protein
MKRTTARAPWVDNRPFKNTATKHNKYANDKRKQHFEDASFKIFFPKIRVVLHKVRDGITKCRLIKSFYSVAKVARPDFIRDMFKQGSMYKIITLIVMWAV